MGPFTSAGAHRGMTTATLTGDGATCNSEALTSSPSNQPSTNTQKFDAVKTAFESSEACDHRCTRAVEPSALGESSRRTQTNSLVENFNTLQRHRHRSAPKRKTNGSCIHFRIYIRAAGQSLRCKSRTPMCIGSFDQYSKMTGSLSVIQISRHVDYVERERLKWNRL
jgi:hypothetical protein